MLFHLYLVSGLELLIPTISLIYLFAKHKYRFASIISGIGAYYVAGTILMALATMMMSVLGMDELYWKVHPFGETLTSYGLNAVFMCVSLYVLMRFTLKNRGKVYDAFAMGIGFGLWGAIERSISIVYTAYIYKAGLNGKLESMVNESVTMADLEATIADVDAAGAFYFYSQLISLIALIGIAIVASIFFYLAMKKKKIQYFLLTIPAVTLVMILLGWAAYTSNPMVITIANLIACIAAGVIIWRFMVWYRAKQRALLYRRKQYKSSSDTSAEENND